MIRKGTALSRAVAAAIAFGPLVVAVIAFAAWAVTAWGAAGARIEAASEAIHRIDARRSQAELYGPLGGSWREFAASSGSGLVRDPDVAAAAAAVVTRVEDYFAEAGGDGVVSVIGVTPARDGLELIHAEARGILPQSEMPTFLANLESDEPFLFVEFLDIRRASGDGAPALDVRVRFSAYRLTEGPSLEGGAE